MMNKRIIPVSSGKGGVGKTTFAINLSLSLSRFGKTVLVDLDTGTSSVRNVIDAPVVRDLYHFFKRQTPLDQCVTQLGEKLDPQRAYGNFGFVAAPLHIVEELTNMRQSLRDKLIDAINELDAQYIILDLKAGMDPFVIDFLPQSNEFITRLKESSKDFESGGFLASGESISQLAIGFRNWLEKKHPEYLTDNE